jgi:alpha-L-arabinofuranosidase
MIPYLDASATISEDGNTVYVAVANLHINESIKTQLLLDKLDFSPEAKLFELYDEDYMAENTFQCPDKITIKESLLTNISNPFTYNFKPHSVTVMEFRKR